MPSCRRWPAHAGATATLVAGLLAGCADGTGPGAPATYALRVYDGRALPAPAFSVSAGYTYDITGATLSFPGGLGAGGTAALRTELRVGGPGEAPRAEERVRRGAYARRGASVDVAFEGGDEETFAVESGGARLRTTAQRCAADGCDAVLHVSEYERQPPVP